MPEDVVTPMVAQLDAVRRRPDLDALRPDVVKAWETDGTAEGFATLQAAFRRALNRVKRVPLRDRDW